MNPINRRQFLSSLSVVSAKIALASAGLYVVGLALSKDGNYAFGAKWTYIGNDVCVNHACCGNFSGFVIGGDCSGFENMPAGPPPGCTDTCSSGGCTTSVEVPIYQCLP
jgi:hypothetical protein